eukprot:TRINITY_DN1850_c0_g1_i1.p1 TRINITY_DN1850_c0_g1~~TRINITY_DN1850_c0_g1_i1.p1  ORF type:complete len:293 (+),score=-7.09 TRINITY_DN1850_c0_g1_i1:27-905(+)
MKLWLIIIGVLLPICWAGGPWVWNPMDWKDIPKASPSDRIQYYYLLGPLMEWEFSNILSYWNLYHSGIGVVNLNTGYRYTVNLDAVHNVWSDFIPGVKILSNGSAILTWNNQGGVFIYKDIYYDYWHSDVQLLAESSGAQHQQWVEKYLSKVNSTHSFYNLFNVYNHESITLQYISSYTCMDFVWEAINYLSFNLHAQLNVTSAKSNFVNFYTYDEPHIVDYYGDMVERTNVDSFFELLEARIRDMDFWDLVDALLEVYEGAFYIRHQNGYLRLHIAKPYFAIEWKDRMFGL